MEVYQTTGPGTILDMTQTTACKTRCIQQNIYGPCGSGSFNRQQIWACPVFSSLVSGRLRCFNLLVCRSTLMSQPAGSFQRITKQVIRSDQQNQGHSAVTDWAINQDRQSVLNLTLQTNHIRVQTSPNKPNWTSKRTRARFNWARTDEARLLLMLELKSLN